MILVSIHATDLPRVPELTKQFDGNNFRDQKTYPVAPHFTSTASILDCPSTRIECESMDNQVAIPWEKMGHTDLKSYVTKLN